MNHFKVHNSVAFSAFTKRNHHFVLLPRPLERELARVMWAPLLGNCSGLMSIPPQSHVHTKPQNGIFGNRVFADAINTGLGWALNPMLGVLVRGQDTERHTEKMTM